MSHSSIRAAVDVRRDGVGISIHVEIDSVECALQPDDNPIPDALAAFEREYQRVVSMLNEGRGSDE